MSSGYIYVQEEFEIQEPETEFNNLVLMIAPHPPTFTLTPTSSGIMVQWTEIAETFHREKLEAMSTGELLQYVVNSMSPQ